MKKETDNQIKKEKKERYYQGIGRRKRAVASVRLYPQKKEELIINEKQGNLYFPQEEIQQTIFSPIRKLLDKNFKISVKVKGGGYLGQAEAIRLGISRALVVLDIKHKKKLRRLGFLTRDPRKKERKKFGLKKARRAPQWKKR